MNRYYAVLFCLFIAMGGNAQEFGCDGTRYLDTIFEEVKITSDIEYGRNITLGTRDRRLYMDIYEPSNDNLSARPTVVLAHGGSFIGGSKDEFVRLGTDLARRGYVVASISYRLIDGLVIDSIGMSEAVVMAVGDMKAAIRFLKDNAFNVNDYGIDPEMVFAGGTSAGGVMASHVGALDDDDELPGYLEEHFTKHGGLEGNSNNITNVNSSVVGVLNYSGALARVNWIDSDDPPFISFHDEFDEIVPCGYGRVRAVWFPAFLYGSCEMNKRGDEQGVHNLFTLYPGSDGHVSYMFNNNYEDVLAQSTQFLEQIICENISGVGSPNQISFSVRPNPASEEIRITNPSSSLLRYDVISSQGQSLMRSEFEGSTTINLTHLPNGLYFINVVNKDGLEGSRSFLKH